jgi:hypothetical protein
VLLERLPDRGPRVDHLGGVLWCLMLPRLPPPTSPLSSLYSSDQCRAVLCVF